MRYRGGWSRAYGSIYSKNRKIEKKLGFEVLSTVKTALTKKKQNKNVGLRYLGEAGQGHIAPSTVLGKTKYDYPFNITRSLKSFKRYQIKTLSKKTEKRIYIPSGKVRGKKS